ncbi:hypothetical protein RHMOL_Rhmol03G0017600 [Rhododendron molle]|uniref:Uncharacterized protein n=1 Tax=Rhododendron molle TaxID=49168 RepID=A0ACC0PB27_RHOML|nr:hypothetical protein RHMOL_Rhmol03G0017600 [Rhododendron molle]
MNLVRRFRLLPLLRVVIISIDSASLLPPSLFSLCSLALSPSNQRSLHRTGTRILYSIDGITIRKITTLSVEGFGITSAWVSVIFKLITPLVIKFPVLQVWMLKYPMLSILGESCIQISSKASWLIRYSSIIMCIVWNVAIRLAGR